MIAEWYNNCMSKVDDFNNRLALKITNVVSTMWTAYIFSLLALMSLPAILVQGQVVPAHIFPHWLISVSLIALISWIAQTFLQLVLLSVIMVGQRLQADTTIKHITANHKHHVSEFEKIKKHLKIK